MGFLVVDFQLGCVVLLQTKDSKGHILAQKDDVQQGKMSKFSFVTETYDTFEICFTSHVPQRKLDLLMCFCSNLNVSD